MNRTLSCPVSSPCVIWYLWQLLPPIQILLTPLRRFVLTAALKRSPADFGRSFCCSPSLAVVGTRGRIGATKRHPFWETIRTLSLTRSRRKKKFGWRLAEQSIMIEQSKNEWQRAQRLRESRSISATEYDQARFAYKSALAKYDSFKADITLSEAQRQQTEQLRENMFIRAPFDGTVISKDARLNAMSRKISFRAFPTVRKQRFLSTRFQIKSITEKFV